jgi:enediyne biosynthesis protein E4
MGAILGLGLSALCQAAPVFTRHPLPLTNSVSVGASLTNRVIATSTNGPVIYQWHRDNTLLEGATNSSLVLTDIQQPGVYFARATDQAGSTDSRPWSVEVDRTFTKITTGPLATVSGFASAWGDYDNDDLPDLFVGTTFGNPTGNSPNMLYHNLGNGAFAAVNETNFPAGIGGISARWADYNNDGWLDLVVTKTGPDLLYRNLGNGSFAQIQNSITSDSGVAFAAAWADINNDGLVDLFLANETSGPNALYLNHDGQVFRKMTNASLNVSVFSQDAAMADYDNDGWQDLVVANYMNNKVLLYHNDGKGSLLSITNSPVTATRGEFSACAWGDYNNDGWLDLFIGVHRNGRNSLYENNRDGTFTRVQTNIISTDPVTPFHAVWGDYDNDGYLDLLATRGLGATVLYHNSGDGQFTKVTTGSIIADGVNGRACAWIDIDNDGFLDAWIARTLGEHNNLYRNNGNSNAWLTVKLEGRTSNRSAIGAKVRVKAKIRGQSTWQLRQITAEDLNAHFGLGTATNIDVLRIEWPWPSGINQEFTNLQPRARFGFREPVRIRVDRAAQANSLSLATPGGGRASYRLETSSDLIHWLPSNAITNQTDYSVQTNTFPISETKIFIRAQESR